MADLASTGIITGSNLIMPGLAAEVGADLVAIDGGTFNMGAADLTEREQPIHPVQLSSFRMQAHQVTNRLYARHSDLLAQARHILMAQHPKRNRPVVVARVEDPRALDALTPDGMAELFSGFGTSVTFGALRTCMESFRVFEIGSFESDQDLEYPNRPVVERSWYEALAFLAMAGLTLPTEAEWEYGAKGPKHNAEYGTASGHLSHAEACYSDPEAEKQGPVDVGSYPANGFRLFDMAGNTYDWVADWLGNYPADGQLIHNPTGPLTGQCKVVRGGGWRDCKENLHSSRRNRCEPDRPSCYVGFRGVSPGTP